MSKGEGIGKFGEGIWWDGLLSWEFDTEFGVQSSDIHLHQELDLDLDQGLDLELDNKDMQQTFNTWKLLPPSQKITS